MVDLAVKPWVNLDNLTALILSIINIIVIDH
jgi:hypothetical protein